LSVSCSSVRSHGSNTNLEFINKEISQWNDLVNGIEYAKKSDTIMLMGGLSPVQDMLIEPALKSIGENYIALPNADFKSFQIGKSYGNRGQCNPTYFTVGNLIKYLQDLRDKDGLSPKAIVEKYIFVTAGGCGPCRFGMYITEYRKALADAGFAGFRVMSFEHNKGIFQANDGEDNILTFSPKFFMTLIKAFIIGDIINILGYRMRPYEMLKGATDEAMRQSRELISKAFLEKNSLLLALWKSRKYFSSVQLDRLQPKPKVMITGEFWATLTEGDGNYNLHRFLEAEGAECVPQPLMNRLMLSIWEAEYERKNSEKLNLADKSLIDFSSAKSKILIKLAKMAVSTHFKLYANAIGLINYHLSDMDKLAKLGAKYYPMDSNGGEGHLEVAHLVESAKENLSHLILSIKPFGCMPSSAVSDGIQSLVMKHYPNANFLSLETSGEGAANFYSRVQMALFKAKQSAKDEFDELEKPNITDYKLNLYTYNPDSKYIGTAARIIKSLS